MSSFTDPTDIAAVALLDEPVRHAVYDWVVAQARPVGREETARALRITRALATFHLDRLAAAGLLDADYRRLNERTGPGAGRPARVYWRADTDVAVSLPPRRYDLAADTLARALEADPDAAARSVRAAGHEAGRAMGAEARRGSRVRDPARRLGSALAAHGYEPAAPDESGMIRLRNCPYDAIVEEHRPLVCSMNLAMAEGLTEAIAADGAYRPVLDLQPGSCCVTFVPSRG
jgi:predicted ArsR family transcriptional regulator